MCIDPHGRITVIYRDDLRPALESIGTTEIRRASHVEPDTTGRWYADLSPVNGPRLGPFLLRQEALDAELAWLEAHGIPFPEKKEDVA
jgi:hypothetical protein